MSIWSDCHFRKTDQFDIDLYFCQKTEVTYTNFASSALGKLPFTFDDIYAAQNSR